jgi:predicted O-methyltransferase YrrM
MAQVAEQAVADSQMARRIRARIEQIYSTKSVKGEDDSVYSIMPAALPPERGRFLLEMCRTQHPAATLEVGLAWGLSTLHIFQALAENRVAAPHHVIMDPFQSSVFHNAALRELRELGLERSAEFYPQPSGLVLPRLVGEGRQFDLAFIDGDHRFESVFVDLFYVDQLLKPGGVVVFDDMSWDGVYLACRFAQTNYGYETIAELAKPRDGSGSAATGRPLMRACRKPVQPVERDESHFVSFFDDFTSNQFGPRLTASTLRYEGLLALREGRRAEARRCFRQALRIDRWHVKTYLRLIRTYLPPALIRATTGRTKAPS